MKRGWVWWVLTALLAVVAASVAFFLGRQLQPPPLIDAEAVRGPIEVTASVETRALSEPVVFRADVVAEDTLEVAPPRLPEGSDPVVTSLHVAAADLVEHGDLLVTVADRPLIALEGPVPMFRDIKPSDEGSDVEILQRALVRLGFEIEVDGRYGRATERAIVDLFAGLGLTPLHTGGESDLRQLESEVDLARESGDQGALSAAIAARDQLKETIGFYVARGEIAFVPTLPRHLLSVPLLGETWADEADQDPNVLGLNAGDLTLEGVVPIEFADLLAEEQLGQAFAEGSEDSFAVQVSSVGPERISDETGEWISVELVPVDPLPSTYLGSNLRIEVTSDTESPVTAVPITAVYTAADGTTFVKIAGGREVEVAVGRVIGGWAEVLAGDIEVGDLVVVGIQ